MLVAEKAVVLPLFSVEGRKDPAVETPLGTAALGRVGELRAEALLLEMGLDVARPSIDRGVDLLAGGVGVQVKAARLSERVNGARVYGFSCTATFAASPAEVFVFHGYDEGRWWVVPRRVLCELGLRQTVNIPSVLVPNAGGVGRPNRIHAVCVYEDAWHVFG